MENGAHSPCQFSGSLQITRVVARKIGWSKIKRGSMRTHVWYTLILSLNISEVILAVMTVIRWWSWSWWNVQWRGHPIRAKITRLLSKSCIQAARQLGSNGVEIAGCSPNCRVSNVQHVLLDWPQHMVVLSIPKGFHLTQTLELQSDTGTNCRKIGRAESKDNAIRMPWAVASTWCIIDLIYF